MNADDVARFLKANPGFFELHPGLLESIANDCASVGMLETVAR